MLKNAFEMGFVTGHDFSHAGYACKIDIRLQPLQMLALPHSLFSAASSTPGKEHELYRVFRHGLLPRHSYVAKKSAHSVTVPPIRLRRHAA
jgi:hypothetical protein